LPDSRMLIQGDADEVVNAQLSINWGTEYGFDCVVELGVGHFYHGHLTALKVLLIDHWSALTL
jgi:alpha/beta superfamily hydrolase